MLRTSFAVALACLLVCPLAARADLFVLANQGQVQGDLLNKDENPRKKYVIQTSLGVVVTLDKEQVVEVRRQSPAEIEYGKIRGQYPDTVEGQWQLAEWCRKNNLLPSRQAHLKRVLELDADHELARRALGFSRVEGRWTTQEEVMSSRGYVKYKGEWMYPQEVELLEQARKAELAEKEWFSSLKRWREWLDNEKSDKALEQINKISDPFAVKAIHYQLEHEKKAQVRELWLEALGRIGSGGALIELIDRSLKDPDHEVRLSAIDQLVPRRHPDFVDKYVKALKSEDNAQINRAAVGLAAMSDPSAIGPLIEALVTSHKFKVGTDSGAINTTFNKNGGGGLGGLSVGTQSKTIVRQLSNENVRDALVKLSGVNFNFDTEQWKVWYAAQKKSQSLNARRY